MSSRIRQRWRKGGQRTQANEAIQNTLNNFGSNFVNTPGRIAQAVNDRLQGVSQQLNNVPATQQNVSVRPIGSLAGDGSGRRWAGQSYGYQSPESFNQLMQQGHFRAGDIALRRVGNDITQSVDPRIRQAAANAAGQVAGQAQQLYNNAPAPVQQVLNVAGQGLQAVDAGLEAVSRATNTSRLITDELTVGALTLGGGQGVKAVRQGLKAADNAVPLTRQAAQRGTANRIRRRLEERQLNRPDAGRVQLGRPGELEPKVRGANRTITNAPPAPRQQDIESLRRFPEGELSAKQIREAMKGKTGRTAQHIRSVADKAGVNGNVNWGHLSLSERHYLDVNANPEYYAALKQRDAAKEALRKARKAAPKDKAELPGLSALPPITQRERRWYPETVRGKTNQRIREAQLRREFLTNGPAEIQPKPRAPIVEYRTRGVDGTPIPPERPGLIQDRAPRKGDLPSRTEREALERLNARTSGRKPTPAELKEKRALEKFLRDNKANLPELKEGLNGWHYPSRLPADERLRGMRELSKGTGPAAEAAKRNLYAEMDRRFGIVEQANKARERLAELERRSQGFNTKRVKQGRREKLVDIIPRDPDLDPRQVGVSQANKNAVRAAEVKGSKDRIKAATRRRMTKEAPNRIGPYEDYKDGARRSRNMYEDPQAVSIGKDDITAVRRHRTKQIAERRRARNAERTRQYRDEFNRTVPAPTADDVKALLETRARKEWDESYDTLSQLYKSEETFVRSRTSRKAVARAIKNERAELYRELYGSYDEARLNKPNLRLRTDNSAGKESLKRQFRDARERRGMPNANAALRARKAGQPVEMPFTGDTRNRGLSRRQPDGSYGGAANPRTLDRIGRRTNKQTPHERFLHEEVGGVVKREREEMVQGRIRRRMLNQPTKGMVAPRQGPVRAAPVSSPSTRGRTVPAAPTVLDKGKGLNQPKPSNRIRQRLAARRKRSRNR